MRQNIKDFLTSGYMGLAMGGKFLWGVIGGLGILGWIYSTIATGNPYLRLPIWLYILSLLVALSIGLTAYFGQHKKTEQMENWGKGLANDIQISRDTIKQLEKKIRELEAKNNP
jgi:hypothetical protein